MGTEILLSELDRSAFQKALDYCMVWGERHQAEVGVAEMALGAGILSWGVMSGHIHIGEDVIASKLAEIGGVSGLSIGAAGAVDVALTILKGLFIGGVAGVQGVTAVPAFVLIGGAAAILGAFGYVAGDLVEKAIDPPMGFAEFLGGASVLAIGVGLMIDGARRIIGDERVLAMASSIKNGVIYLSAQTTDILASTKDEFDKLVQEFDKSTSAKAVAMAGVGVGAVGGSILAGSTVTVLGSNALGAAALSLGLVSAPVWPVVLGGAAGLALGVAAWKGFTHFKGKQPAEEQQSGSLLPAPRPDSSQGDSK